MKWKFEKSETSNGAYKCIGKRDTGNIVSINCGEDDFFRLYEQSFHLETKIGASPSLALYLIIQGCLPNWRSSYNESAFGSWVIEDLTKEDSFVYDGKDSYLLIYDSEKEIVWQGQVKEIEDVDIKIFERLVNYS